MAQKKGPYSDFLKTLRDKNLAASGHEGGICLIDEAEFGLVTGPNGKKRIMFPEEARIALAGRRRAPHPPQIQQDLLEARQLKERLDKTPGLKQEVLAKELGISRFELIRRLNLLRLAPEIQERIMALPPTSHRCPISKRTLRPITVISDFSRQRDAFLRLQNLSS